MLSVRCLSVCLVCLSVTLVHCGETVGRIKIKFDLQIGLGPGHIVLDGDPAPKFSAHIYYSYCDLEHCTVVIGLLKFKF